MHVQKCIFFTVNNEEEVAEIKKPPLVGLYYTLDELSGHKEQHHKVLNIHVKKKKFSVSIFVKFLPSHFPKRFFSL